VPRQRGHEQVAEVDAHWRARYPHGQVPAGARRRDQQALGGYLQLHSPPGAGTTLEITLPLHDPGPTPGPTFVSQPARPLLVP
jgi:hypothetical protein